MQVWQHRGGLRRTLAALQRGEIKLGFMGGSITDSRGGNNWPEPVAHWFVETFPGVRVRVYNGAVSGTSSELACVRARETLIEPDCDLVFYEYCVNDSGLPDERRQRSEEGFMRQLLATENGRPSRDVVMVYTYHMPFYDDIMAGRMPAPIAALERVAEHYNVGSVWMSLYAIDEVKAGRMRWDEWIPDGCHPTVRGSLSYGSAVSAFLQRELIDAPSTGVIAGGELMPAPLNPHHWQQTVVLPLECVQTRGPWTLRRWYNQPFLPYVWDTAAIGAGLSFNFEGRGLVLVCDLGLNSAEFRWRLDGGEWRDEIRVRPEVIGPSGHIVPAPIIDDLPYGPHTFELEIFHGQRADCRGTNMRLAMIGVLR